MARPDDAVDDFAPIAPLVDALRLRRDAEPVPPMGVELRAVIEELGAPTGPRIAPPASASRRRSRRMRTVVGAAVAALAVSGLGVAGALPAPVQRVVSGTAGHLGLDLPDPDPTTSTVPPEVPTEGRDGARGGSTAPATRPTPPSSAAIRTSDTHEGPATGSTTAPHGDRGNGNDSRGGPDESPVASNGNGNGGHGEEGDATPPSTTPTTADDHGGSVQGRSGSGDGTEDQPGSGSSGDRGSSDGTGRSSSSGGTDVVRSGGSGGGEG
jgi:hypothetical protein